VAFVTGAGSGIGRATAIRLAADGAAVGVVDLDEAKAGATVATIEETGGRALAVRVDVRDRAAVRAARDAVVEAFGPITRLVNCAGVVTMSALDDLTDEEWDLVLDVNLKGYWLVAQEVSRAMDGGAVVNISTIESEVVVS